MNSSSCNCSGGVEITCNSCGDTYSSCSSCGTCSPCSCSKSSKSSKCSKSSTSSRSSSRSSKSYTYSSGNSDCKPRRCKEPSYFPDQIKFRALIYPATNVKASFSTHGSEIEFIMRRKNKTVSLQYEPFTCEIGASGSSYLYINQSLTNLPPYPMSLTYSNSYKGTYQNSVIDVDGSSSQQIKLYIFASKSSNTTMGDSMIFPGTCITWIMDE